MSVDLSATVREPVGLANVVSGARSMLGELLGLAAVPEIVVFAEPRFDSGRRVHPEQPMGAAELAAQTIGGETTAGHYDVCLADHDDAAWLNVFHLRDEDAVQVTVSPTRTCAGVVLATALSLAAAQGGRGDFVDDQIRMLDPGEMDPAIFIARTRLSGTGLGTGVAFDSRCEQFMRQFARLGGWPRAVTLVQPKPTTTSSSTSSLAAPAPAEPDGVIAGGRLARLRRGIRG